MTANEKVNISHTKKYTTETDASLKDFEPASFMSELARMIYYDKIEDLVKRGIVTTMIKDIFMIYCELLADFQETTKELERMEGVEDMHKTYRLKGHRLKLIDHIMSYARRFGFTPTDRGKVISETPDKSVNPFAEFINAG